MAHDVTEAKARLEKLQKREAKRKHRTTASEYGFDLLADYEAWQVLEDLRNATLTSRRNIEAAERKKPAPVGLTMTIPSYSIPAYSTFASSGRFTIS